MFAYVEYLFSLFMMRLVTLSCADNSISVEFLLLLNRCEMKKELAKDLDLSVSPHLRKLTKL